MRLFIHLINGIPRAWGLTPHGVRLLAPPNTCFPAGDAQYEEVDLAEFGIETYHLTPRPSYDPLTHDCIEATPVQIDGAWAQAWQVVPAAPEVAARRQADAVASIQAAIIAETQVRLDTWAQSRGYDSILSACSYATSSVPRFVAEGRVAVNARDATWDALFAGLQEIQAGKRAMPAGFAEIEPLLPVLEWPQ